MACPILYPTPSPFPGTLEAVGNLSELLVSHQSAGVRSGFFTIPCIY